MTLSTYADLQTQVANWLARDDLVTYIPDFITIFEAAAARRLRLRPQETSTTLTTASGSVALPTDYLGWRRLTWAGSTRVDLAYVHPSRLQNEFPTTPAGTPSWFTIEGTTLKIRPTDDTASIYEFLYFAKVPAISGALNWLWTAYPDVYLFGTLFEAYMFNKDAANAALWKARRDEIFDEMEMKQFREQGALAVRTGGIVI